MCIRDRLSAINILEEKNISIDIIDIGGGIGINYKDEKPLNINDYSKLISNKFGFLNKKIILEPGRYLTAESGVLITKIIYIKENQSKNFS